jgi:hypothetical protein
MGFNHPNWHGNEAKYRYGYRCLFLRYQTETSKELSSAFCILYQVLIGYLHLPVDFTYDCFIVNPE